MPSSYSPLLRAELQASGENDATWGDKTNANFEDVFEVAIAGAVTLPLFDADYTLTVNSGTPDEARNAILIFTGVLTAQRTITIPSSSKIYIVRNQTTGGFPVLVKTAIGTGKAVEANTSSIIYCDGTDVQNAFPPVAENAVTPSKVDTNTANVWRFSRTMGVGVDVESVSNYGVFGVGGSDGARVLGYAGSTQVGQVQLDTAGVIVSAVGARSIFFTTNGVQRMSIGSAGTISLAGNTSITGTLSTSSNVSVSGGLSVVGPVSAAGGITGITATNVRTALGYTPIQQGTGDFQNPAFAVKIGWDTGTNRLRAAVENTDLGTLVTSTTTGVFIPAVNAGGRFEFASNASGTAATSATLQIRELNRAGSQGNAASAAPRLGFHWAGVIAGSIELAANGVMKFMDNPGTARADIWAKIGYFDDNVFFYFSDDRLKTKHGKIINAMAIVRSLEGFRYTLNNKAKSFGFKNERVQLGLSAQQVKSVLPELIELAPFDQMVDKDGAMVSKSGDDYMTVDYARMVPVLVQAIKEQDDELWRLRKDLDDVLARVSALEKRA